MDFLMYIMSVVFIVAGVYLKQYSLIFLIVGIIVGVVLLLIASYLTFIHFYGLTQARDALINEISQSIKGNEQILDIATGSGIILIALAKLLTNGGMATGVDVFEKVQPGTRLRDKHQRAIGIVQHNAEIEGVADRIKVLGGDPRNPPFPTQTFDITTCFFNIHLLSRGTLDRELTQITRVTKNGGLVVLYDFWGMNHSKSTLELFHLKLEKTVYPHYLPFSKIYFFRVPAEGIESLVKEKVADKMSAKKEKKISLATMSPEEQAAAEKLLKAKKEKERLEKEKEKEKEEN